MSDLKKNWITWVVIVLCLLAIPAGLMSKQASRDTSGKSALSLALRGKIKVIYLTGMIMDRDEETVLSFSGTTQSSLKKIRKAIKDDSIKGVLLRINSPGGTVGASQEINQAVTELKAEKPVVTSMGDITASGGYYIACATDKIYANPGTLTGSIGVIMNMLNFKGLADKVGVYPEVIKSGKFKDIASPYRQMSEEERNLLQAIIMDSYDQFVTAVATGRKMKREEVLKLADGRIFTGRQAKTVGLVDELGSQKDAIEGLQAMCKEKYKLKKDLPVDDSASQGFLDSLFDSAKSHLAPPSASSILEPITPLSMQPRFNKQPLWLWQ